MPDLTDDLPHHLRALLAERAEHAPAVPAPTDALTRRVRRRQAARAGIAVAACTAGAVAVLGLAAAARPAHEAVSPAGTTSAGPAGECDAPRSDGVMIDTHPTRIAFGRECYRAAAGTQFVGITYRGPYRHDVVVTPDFPTTEPPAVRPVDGTYDPADPPEPIGRQRTHPPVLAGTYTLTCRIHPEMRARLVVS